MHWLPRSVDRSKEGKFKHAGIFSHHPVVSHSVSRSHLLSPADEGLVHVRHDLDALAEDEEDDDADEDERHVELLPLRLQATLMGAAVRRQLLLHPQRRMDSDEKEEGTLDMS